MFPRLALSGFSVVLAEERLEQVHTHCLYAVGVRKEPAVKSSRHAELLLCRWSGREQRRVSQWRAPEAPAALEICQEPECSKWGTWLFSSIAAYCMPPHPLSPSVYERQIAHSKLIRVNHEIWLDWSIHVYRLWFLFDSCHHALESIVSGCF